MKTTLTIFTSLFLSMALTESRAQSIYEPYTFSTLAGGVSSGSEDGVGLAARFNSPTSVAVDSSGNVYVADSGNNTIRKVTPAGVVTTLAGRAVFDANGNPVGGSADGTAKDARFRYPSGVAVDNEGTSMSEITPVTSLSGKSISLGASASFRVSATSTHPPALFQWRSGGSNLPAATGARLVLRNIQLTNAGVYDVVVTDLSSSTTSRRPGWRSTPPLPRLPPARP